MKRTVLIALLLVAYAGVFGRRLITGSVEEFDVLAPQALEVERALADKRYDHALPVAQELQTLNPDEPLVELWLALTYDGLHRFGDEAKAWERFIEIGSAPEEACPWLAYAYSRVNPGEQSLPAFERCAKLDQRDPERLVDLGSALAQAGKTREALAVYKRAADLDPRHPVIAERIERLSHEPAGGQQ